MQKDQRALQIELNQALQKGWQELSNHKIHPLLKDYFFELARTGFFEQKFRGKIANPAHELAVKVMSAHAQRVFLKHGITLRDFYPGNFASSTGEEITDDPAIALYEHRHFHNQAWKNGQAWANIIITICHIRGTFEFPKAPFVTLSEVA